MAGGEGVAEKRKVERKYLVFYLRIFAGESLLALGHVVNLSSRGMMMIGNRHVGLDESFHLRIRLPKGVSDRHEMIFDATSRWSMRDANPDFVLSGFCIDRLSAIDRKDMLVLLEEFGYQAV